MPDTATDQAKQQQIALLQAIAEQGTRGQAMYQQQQDANQATKQQAVQSALDRGTSINGPGAAGAPQGLLNELGAQAAKPADEQGAYLSAGQTSFNQDQAALTSANDTYMNQLGQAIPLVAAHANAAAAAQARDNAIRKELADIELQRAKIGLERDKLPPLQSVAEQKYAAEQATAARQQGVVNRMPPGSTRSAFLDIIANNGSFEEAASYLNEGARSYARGAGGVGLNLTSGFGAHPRTELQATFGDDVDTAAIQAALLEYYGYGAPAGAGGSDAPVAGRSGTQ